MRKLLVPTLMFAAGCNAAHADQIASSHGPRIALEVAPDKIQAPYDVQIINESGENAPTYAFKGRYYVQGNDGNHYTIRIVNPTPQRVEAVVSVDGLDVVDGESGDLKKRGYIVPAYGETRIEGFRTSLADVASFRFSSVDNSYAGKKGKARNVGVIAVAIFDEQAPPPDQVIVQPEVVTRRPYRWTDDLQSSRGAAPAPSAERGRVANKDKKAEAKEAPAPAAPPPARVSSSTAAPRGGAAMDEGDYYEPAPAPTAPRTNRPGLGTEFGESRYSAAQYTKFVRSNNRPVAIAELRYNDAAGLIALGIPVQPLPDEGELMTRETADPFPGDHSRFSRPPSR